MGVRKRGDVEWSGQEVDESDGGGEKEEESGEGEESCRDVGQEPGESCRVGSEESSKGCDEAMAWKADDDGSVDIPLAPM